MTYHRREAVLIMVMTAMLAVAAAWNLSWMNAQHDLARRAAEDLAASRSHARAIESLRTRPAMASSQALGIRELGDRIEAATHQAGFTPSSLEGVLPQPARRVGDTAYVRRPTALALRSITLPQAVTFLHQITEGSALKVQDIRLRTPGRTPSSDAWDIDVTIVDLIYEPAPEKRI